MKKYRRYYKKGVTILLTGTMLMSSVLPAWADESIIAPSAYEKIEKVMSEATDSARNVKADQTENTAVEENDPEDSSEKPGVIGQEQQPAEDQTEADAEVQDAAEEETVTMGEEKTDESSAESADADSDKNGTEEVKDEVKEEAKEEVTEEVTEEVKLTNDIREKMNSEVAAPAKAEELLTPDNVQPATPYNLPKKETDAQSLKGTELPAQDGTEGYTQVLSGKFMDDTLACGRTGKVYIPEDCRYGAYVYFIAIPEGKGAFEFLEKSGWIDAADERGFIIYALEASSEADDDDETYIEQAIKSGTSNTYYYVAGSYYLVGYGALGTKLQQYGLQHPLTVAAAAYMNASDIDQGFIDSLDEKFADTRHTGTCSEIPTSVWLMGDDVTTVQKFYQKADGCPGSEKHEGDYGDVTVYEQTQNTEFTTPGKVCEVAVGEMPEEVEDEELTSAIAAFLDRYYAYGSVATGWATGVKPAYGDDEDQVHRVEFTQEFDGKAYQREYLVYDGSNGSQKAPVLLIAPGHGTVDTVNLDTAGWVQTAKKYGVILVGLTATAREKVRGKVNCISWATEKDGLDEEYLKDVVARIKENYPVDESRIYINGQSQGCVFAQHMALFMNDTFAAAGVTSGPIGSSMWDKSLSPSPSELAGIEKYGKIPFKIIVGEYDVAPYKMPPESNLRNTLNLFATANGISAADNKEVVDSYEEAGTKGRFTTYQYKDSDGNPVVEFSADKGRGHSIVYEDTDNLTEWLLHWSQDDQGNYCYDQKVYTDKKAVDLDQYLLDHTTRTKDTTRTFTLNHSQANVYPAAGYFNLKLDDRNVKIYIADHSAIRSYITVIAVPNGVTDTYDFLQKQGWFEQADKYGETLIVLEPKDGKWGTPDSEKDYLEKCIGEVIGNDGYDTRSKSNGGLVQTGSIPVSDGTKCTLFSGHSTNYYVGYGEGCAVLESWTAENPDYVIGQAFIGGSTDDMLKETLEKAGKRTYNGVNVGTYNAGTKDDSEFLKDIQSVVNAGDAKNASMMKNADIPVPTFFAGYDEDDYSVSYWKKSNDASSEAEDGTYYQDIHSDAWQTLYANDVLKRDGASHGISQVRVESDDGVNAEKIRDFLSQFTRYTFQFAYSNTLGPRTDYYETATEVRKAADGAGVQESYDFGSVEGVSKKANLIKYGKTQLVSPFDGKTTGTYYSMISSFNDYDEDGTADPRESIIYIPDSVKETGKEVPLVVVYPGMTQSCSTFMDCSYWWNIANENSIAVMILGEYTVSNPVSLTWGKTNDSADFTRANLALFRQVIAKDAGISLDETRVYASGHSLGSMTSETLAHTTENYFAGIASTSFQNTAFGGDKTGMPTYLMCGQADLPFITDEPWEEGNLNTWVKAAAKYNGLDVDFETGNKQAFLKTTSEHDESGRFRTYTWADQAGVPLLKFGRTLAREHNCMPQEAELGYAYLKDFTRAADGTRYYQGQKIDIANSAKTSAVDVSTLAKPAVDYTRGNHQEYEGYYTQTIDVDGESRTLKYYVASGMPIRGYFTILTVPEGMNTDEFLEKSGWKDIADKRKEGLLLLEPKNEAWGSVEDEKKYVDQAINTFSAGNGTYFKIFGEHYLVGYKGNGGSALQQWAAENPVKVISAVFVDANDVSADALAAAGEKKVPYSAQKVSDTPNSEVPVPVWIIDDDLNSAKAVVDYWKKSDDVAAQPAVDDTMLSSQVFEQADAQSSMITGYKNIKTKVAVLEKADTMAADPELTDTIENFLNKYTRYENAYIGGNALNERADYAKLGIKTKTFTQTFDGVDYAREYMVYVPDSAKGKAAPVVYVCPGGSQTDNVFMDATGWWQVARDNGFILVMTMAQEGGAMSPSWSVGDNSRDIDYMKTVISQVDSEYNTDTGRRYVTGQSMGSLMSLQCSIAMPEYFAAIGSTSATMSTAQINAYTDGATDIIPYYLILGEYDVDSWDFQQTGENANKCSTTVSYYLNRNGLADSANPTEVRENGRYKTNIWENEAGIPLFKFGQTAERNHNCIPSEMPMLYEWFSHWSQAADGTRLYDGKSIKLNEDKPSDHTGGHANSGRGGRRGNSSRAEYTKGYHTGNQKNGGNWQMDTKGWWFRHTDGTYPQGTWRELSWNGNSKWYHFDEAGYCQGGWLNDTDGNTYFLYDQHDGNFGYMLTGWQLIEGKWYYFEPEEGKMQGHLYKNTITPDGYRVDADGVWIR